MLLKVQVFLRVLVWCTLVYDVDAHVFGLFFLIFLLFLAYFSAFVFLPPLSVLRFTKE